MPIGPGMYVALIVIGGRKGSGFSAQLPPEYPEYIEGLVTVLRRVADEIERDAKKIKN